MSTIDKWFTHRQNSCGIIILIDPDRGEPAGQADLAQKAVLAGADAILVGSSLLLGDGLERTLKAIRAKISAPIFLFPGNGHQISPEADGILFLSLISGRNPRWLIEEQVESAPRIKALGLPALPTAYILIESGRVTAVQFMSATVPIPRNKPEITVAHAIAAEMLGLKAIFLEAGSGAEFPVPIETVRAVREASALPLIVGGGIRDVDTAVALAHAGADFLVVGTHLEETGNADLIREIKNALPKP